jgi:septal ring factor EnvC (AmiA/AmiB activator)
VSSTLPVAEGLSAVGAAVVVQFFNWLSSRDKSRLYAQGAVDRAMEKALKGVSDQLDRTDDRLRAIEGQHEQCERDLAEVRRRLDESERDRAELKAQIDRLMSGPVARTGDRAPP